MVQSKTNAQAQAWCMPGKELKKFLKPSPWADPKTQNMPNQLAEDFPDTKPFCQD